MIREELMGYINAAMDEALAESRKENNSTVAWRIFINELDSIVCRRIYAENERKGLNRWSGEPIKKELK